MAKSLKEMVKLIDARLQELDRKLGDQRFEIVKLIVARMELTDAPLPVLPNFTPDKWDNPGDPAVASRRKRPTDQRMKHAEARRLRGEAGEAIHRRLRENAGKPFARGDLEHLVDARIRYAWGRILAEANERHSDRPIRTRGTGNQTRYLVAPQK